MTCSQNKDCECILKIKLQFGSNFRGYKSMGKKLLHQWVEDKTTEAIGTH